MPKNLTRNRTKKHAGPGPAGVLHGDAGVLQRPVDALEELLLLRVHLLHLAVADAEKLVVELVVPEKSGYFREPCSGWESFGIIWGLVHVPIDECGPGCARFPCFVVIGVVPARHVKPLFGNGHGAVFPFYQNLPEVIEPFSCWWRGLLACGAHVGDCGSFRTLQMLCCCNYVQIYVSEF